MNSFPVSRKLIEEYAKENSWPGAEVCRMYIELEARLHELEVHCEVSQEQTNAAVEVSTKLLEIPFYAYGGNEAVAKMTADVTAALHILKGEK